MNFKSLYRRECLMSGTSPLHVIESTSPEFTLNFKFFRIPTSEWAPILLALRSDQTLKKIMITIDFADHTVNNPSHKKKLTRLQLLISSVASHLSQNANLKEIHLIGLPLSTSDVETLAQGIRKSTSLQHVSLQQCKIGDCGAQLISEAVQVKPSIVWLDLSSCGLTSKSGEALFEVIHHQSVSRENAVWKASLRQETPVLDLMGGLRRLTLNDNDLGDAVKQLASALLEDKWIMAIDLQYCHMDDPSLNSLIQAAMKNRALVLIDIRYNPNLSESLIGKLKEVLEKNNLNMTDPLKFKSIEMTQPQTLITSTRQFKPSTVVIESAKKIVKQNSSDKTSRVTPKVVPHLVKPNLTKPSFGENLKPHSANEPRLNNQFNNNDSEKEREDELVRERQMRLDAERQVIKMYGEMELAWARIAKLEKKVKQLKKRNASKPVIHSVLDAGSVVEGPGIWIDPPTLENFQLCLGHLRGLLRELKTTNIVQAKPENEVEVILSTLHGAIRELSSKMTQSPTENQQLLNPKPAAHSESPNQRTAHHYFPMPSSSTFNRKPEDNFRTRQHPRDQREHSKERPEENFTTNPYVPLTAPTENKSSVLKQATVTHRNLTSTPLSEAVVPRLNKMQRLSTLAHEQTSEISKQQLLAELSSSGGPKRTPTPTASTETFRPTSATAVATNPSSNSSSSDRLSKGNSSVKEKNPSSSSERSNPEKRLDSLKNLKGDLEDLLDKFKLKDDPSFHLHNSLISTNTTKSYSEDFQSSTILQSISEKVKLKKASTQVENPKSTSRSSSTLNLSSIVDLLGDFSLGDIGSSTLTPP